MKQVRQGVFETNSSSTHSITICTKEEYERFRAGELMCDRYGEGMKPTSEVERDEDGYCRYETYETLGGDWLENDITPFTTPSGDEMVAICTYGHD